MFGYIRPFKPELLVKEFDFYQSIYCSLCKHLGKNFGILSRLTLSYDCTFLAMLSLSLQNDCPGYQKGRCVVNPLKKCSFCKEGEESFLFASAVSVIMSYYKLMDDLHDSHFWGKLRSRFLLLFFHRSHKKAAKRFPEIEAVVSAYLQNQIAAERDPDAGIDASAHPTAQMLMELLPMIGDNSERQNLILGQLGYFIGRWIYLIDAADDMKKDQKKGNFNPFVKKLVLEAAAPMKEDELKEYCNSVLNQTLSQAISAYQLLDCRHYDPIIKNTLFLGLPAVQKQIIFDKE